MSSMLRPLWRANGSAFIGRRQACNSRSSFRLKSTQSGPDTKPPTALATLHLEDGSSFVGKSFGCHESIEGEVSPITPSDL